MATKVLMVCMGNICRSPIAEGVFRSMLIEAGLGGGVVVDSAATHGYHVGLPPDQRSVRTALRRGIDLSGIRARRVVPQDLTVFDYVLAMDWDNHNDLLALSARENERGKIGLLLDYAPHLSTREVPDPYYGGADGFEKVMDLIEQGARGLLDHIQMRYTP
jgi:protein-tyrosine phosphatase